MKPLSWAVLIDSVPFTKDVIAGKTSLGGSESACLGTMRALAARGHDIHIFTTQLAEDAIGTDAWRVKWHPMADFVPMNEFIEWDVCVALRLYHAFWRRIYARMRILWAQDLLVPGDMQAGVMGISWALDHLAYVSEYHRAQWEDLEAPLQPIGWVTRNGIDLSQVPTSVNRNPNRIIHVSRPERGLGPLLQMWPALKAQCPDATLQVCRYSSMYDQGPGSWSDTCAQFDRAVAAVNEKVGGIEYLGELTKPQLYRAISEAAVMWYPGVSSFAETSCIAATEANACGTPFVGSLRGALPETALPSYENGLLINGECERDHVSPDYGEASIRAVLKVMQQCKWSSRWYRDLQDFGRKHAARYDYTVIAQEWCEKIEHYFAWRYHDNMHGVMRALLHEDDHVAARKAAYDVCVERQHIVGEYHDFDKLGADPLYAEASAALVLCDRVIAGKDQESDHYAEQAIADPLKEAEVSERFAMAVPRFEKATHVLDVACGNGSFAIALTLANPTVRVHGVDYAQGNIDRAREGAERAGVADRCTFERLTVYDYETHQLSDACVSWLHAHGRQFDGLFVGEFLEHVAGYQSVIDGLEDALQPGAPVVYTCPHGPCAELVPRHVPLRRGHVHHFHSDDLSAVFGPKDGFAVAYLAAGITERGVPLGNWLIAYRYQPDRPCGERPLRDRILKTRPMPKLSVGLIVKDEENNLGRCLNSIYKLADEIVIGDTGSTDSTKQIAASYKATMLDLPRVFDHPQGFAGLRNEVLQRCTGDWFLWIDADEWLARGHLLRQYLEGVTFNGYVLHQTHLYVDGNPTFDVPVRLFRKVPSVQFYGCVHEQPQQGDCNGEIYPALDLPDPVILHTGYVLPEGREEKRTERNNTLLRMDSDVFPDRKLLKVLLIREAVIDADVERTRAGGLTVKAKRLYQSAVALYVMAFDTPGDKLDALARPWYEAALQHLGMGFETEVALAARTGGLKNARAKPERIWVRDALEFQRILTYRTEQAAKQMLPVTFKTAPFTLPAVATELAS